MLEKGIYDGKNRFALYMWTSTGSELPLSTPNYPLKTFQNRLQNCPMTPNAQNPRKHMLFSFRAKRLNSYYDTVVNARV